MGDNTIPKIITLRQTSTFSNKSKKKIVITPVDIAIRIKWGKPGKEDALILCSQLFMEMDVLEFACNT